MQNLRDLVYNKRSDTQKIDDEKFDDIVFGYQFRVSNQNSKLKISSPRLNNGTFYKDNITYKKDDQCRNVKILKDFFSILLLSVVF
jgi:hypothetical protein